MSSLAVSVIGVKTAAVLGASLIGGIASSKAAGKAADAQIQSTDANIAVQREQFAATQKLLKPYVDAGSPALKQLASYSDVVDPALDEQQALSGILGPEAQQSAIDRIEQSPLYMEYVAQGENAMLQNASATGGLRGGNMQAALSQYRPQVLQQMIEDKYSKLGGMVSFGGSATNNLASMGQAAAVGESAAGMNLASNVGNSITAAGDARGNAALAQGQAWGNVAGSVGYLGGLGFQGYGPFGGSTPPPQNPNTVG
tara:strand:+ start:880 stop:1647 length:768 start_codon:yes stop_codon:yes gene_type:complete